MTDDLTNITRIKHNLVVADDLAEDQPKWASEELKQKIIKRWAEHADEMFLNYITKGKIIMAIDISKVKINGEMLLKEVEEELSNDEWIAAKKELKIVVKELRAAERLVARLEEKRDRLIGRKP